jgi:hypothetical protein
MVFSTLYCQNSYPSTPYSELTPIKDQLWAELLVVFLEKSLYMRFSHLHACYLFRQSHIPQFDYSGNNWRKGVEIMKLFVM